MPDIDRALERVIKATESYIGVLRRDAHLINGDLSRRYDRNPFLGTELVFIPEGYHADIAAADYLRLHGPIDRIAGCETANLLANEVGVLQNTEDPKGLWFRVSKKLPEKMLSYQLTIKCLDRDALKEALRFGGSSVDMQELEVTYGFPPDQEVIARQVHDALQKLPNVFVRMETR